LAVSTIDSKLRGFIDIEWTAVFTEDKVNFKPMHMPHIGTSGRAAITVEFSRYDPFTIYLLVSHDYWSNMTSEKSPSELWRSKDRGNSWEHIYKLPEGAYERNGNFSGGKLILEDPSPACANNICFRRSIITKKIKT
jgi:hypothetical protein